ncbi:hypothetical protein D3C80_1281480 [compost metagenome]
MCHQHFGGVQHIIPGNQAHGEGWRSLIDGDGGVQRVGVTGGIGDRDGQGWRAVWQRLQVGGRNGGAPVAVGIHGAGVGFTTQGDRNGLPRRGDAGRTRDGLGLAGFCTVQDTIAKRCVQSGLWQAMGKDAQVVAVADRVTGLIDSGHGDSGGAIAQ